MYSPINWGRFPGVQRKTGYASISVFAGVCSLFIHALANLFIQFMACLYLSLPCHIIQKTAMDIMEHIASLPARHAKPVHPLVRDMLKGSVKLQVSQLASAVSIIVNA